MKFFFIDRAIYLLPISGTQLVQTQLGAAALQELVNHTLKDHLHNGVVQSLVPHIDQCHSH